MYNDDKWRVSIEGQVNMPFDTHEQALEYAAAIETDGFECYVYFSPKDQTSDK